MFTQTVMCVSSEAPNKKKGKKKEGDNKYSNTVRLPQSTFDQRANSVKR